MSITRIATYFFCRFVWILNVLCGTVISRANLFTLCTNVCVLCEIRSGSMWTNYFLIDFFLGSPTSKAKAKLRCVRNNVIGHGKNVQVLRTNEEKINCNNWREFRKMPHSNQVFSTFLTDSISDIGHFLSRIPYSSLSSSKKVIDWFYSFQFSRTLPLNDIIFI